MGSGGPTANVMYSLVHAGFVKVKNVQHRTRRKGVRAMSDRPMRVQASTARESRRHYRGIRRRPAGGK